MSHQIDVWSAQKCSCLSQCVRARIVVVKSNQFSAVGFPDFLEDNWQTNDCQNRKLCCSSVTIATCPVFPKNTGNHFLGSALCASNFCWIWLILKYQYSRLLFTFGLIRLNPRFITCYDVIDMFRSSAIVFLENFFRPIDMSLFFLSD